MEMGRNRTNQRAGWPANLYPNRDGFKYRNPVTRKETWMGTNRSRAFAAAKKLNAHLESTDDLVAKALGRGQTVSDAIAVFRHDDVPGRKWAATTAEVYESVIRRTEAMLGKRELDTVTVKDCAEFVRNVTESARGRQQFRLVLGWILACAVEEGWMDSNPAMQTRKFNYERQRERLTADQYRAIWGHAPQWLRNAMDLSLVTLLRREDVANAKFADVRDGKLWIIPSKTKGSTGLRLRFAVDGELAELIARCRDDVLSPYLVHGLPGKARPRDMRAVGRDHHTQKLPEQLTRAFEEARDAAGIEGDNPPTFHEIRSLGGALLQEAGWTVDQIQSLMGHATTAMTKHYLDGHDAPWVDVRSGLALTR